MTVISFLFIPDVGFEIPNRFVVGYALDYNEYFRDLNVSRSLLGSGVPVVVGGAIKRVWVDRGVLLSIIISSSFSTSAPSARLRR